LGEGGFGIVVLAKGRIHGGPEELYAMKCLKKQGITSSTICEIFTEKEALRITRGCPFITTLYACFQSKVCLHFLNFLHSFRLSLILKCTVSVKIWQFFFVPVAPSIDQL
jgi:serine/threonine protein kinase